MNRQWSSLNRYRSGSGLSAIDLISLCVCEVAGAWACVPGPLREDPAGQLSCVHTNRDLEPRLDSILIKLTEYLIHTVISAIAILITQSHVIVSHFGRFSTIHVHVYCLVLADSLQFCTALSPRPTFAVELYSDSPSIHSPSLCTCTCVCAHMYS